MKYLIVGRTGRGKDYLKELLQNMFGWRFVLSTTTRKPRFEGEDTHVFITKNEPAAIPQEDKVAVTFIKNGDNEPDEYFATRQQVEEADAYIIDPKGVDVLLKNMPEEDFEIIYIKADDDEKAREMAIERAKGKPGAAETYDKRYNDENEQFSAFEESLDNGSFVKPNCMLAITLTNDYSEDGMKNDALALNRHKTLAERLEPIIATLKETKTLLTDDVGNIRVIMKDGTEDHFSDKRFAALLMSDDTGLGICLKEYASLDEKILKKHIKKDDNILSATFADYIDNLISDQKHENSEEIAAKVKEELKSDNHFLELMDEYVNTIVQKYV